MKTAEEFIRDEYETELHMIVAEPPHIIWMMQEFAKMHVEEALRIASKLDFDSIDHPKANDYEEAIELTILECYPETNIK